MSLHDPTITCVFSYMHMISLLLSIAFSRGRLCENVLEGSPHHHVHAQRAGGQLLPGGQSRPAQQQTQAGLGVSFHGNMFKKSKRQKTDATCVIPLTSFFFFSVEIKSLLVIWKVLKSNLLKRVTIDWPVM